MQKRFISLMMILMLLGSAFPVLAQDGLSDEELELVEVVAAAYEKLLEVETYRTTGKQTTDQTIDLQGDFAMTLQQTTAQTIESQVRMDADGTDSYTMIDQTATSTSGPTGTTEIETVMEVILVDGEFYMRYTEAPPEMREFFPEGWFKAEDLPGMEMLNLEALADLSGESQLFAFQVSEENVAAIQELDPEVVDGVEMRVFEITWNPDAFKEIAGGNFMDMSSLGVDTEQFLNDLYTNSTYRQILYINTETGLPHRVDFQMTTENLEMEIQGTAMVLSQTVTSSTIFEGFNEPVEIEAPTIGE